MRLSKPSQNMLSNRLQSLTLKSPWIEAEDRLESCDVLSVKGRAEILVAESQSYDYCILNIYGHALDL